MPANLDDFHYCAAPSVCRAGGALLEITKACTPCDFIEGIRPGLRAEMEGQCGMLARVIEGGEMQVGDVIRVDAVKS